MGEMEDKIVEDQVGIKAGYSVDYHIIYPTCVRTKCLAENIK